MSLNSLRFFHLRILLGRATPDRAGARPIGVNLSGSRRSVPALHLFEGVQTETVRLQFDASASSASLKLTLMGRTPARSGFVRFDAILDGSFSDCAYSASRLVD